MDLLALVVLGVAAYLAWKNWATVKTWFGLGE